MQVLTDAPNLPLVIGLPVGLMLVAGAAAVGTFILLTRVRRPTSHGPAPTPATHSEGAPHQGSTG